MKKYDRIAVVIRGQKRVWDYVKHNIFSSYSSIADNVDYYFVTWASPVNSTIVSDFADKSLIKFLELPIDENYDLYGNQFHSPSFFAYSILPYILEVPYDFIFDQRTDIFLFFRDRPLIPIAESSVLYIQGGIFKNSHYYGGQINDCGFMSDIKTYRQLSKRHLFKINKHKTPEAHLYDYCVSSDILVSEYSLCFSYVIVRPNVSKTSLHPISALSYKQLRQLEKNWLSMSSDRKKKYCKKCNIPLSEYSHWKYKIGK